MADAKREVLLSPPTYRPLLYQLCILHIHSLLQRSFLTGNRVDVTTTDTTCLDLDVDIYGWKISQR